MSNSDRARISALFPLTMAVGAIFGAIAHAHGWGSVIGIVLLEICVSLYFLLRDDENVTEER